MTYSKIPNGVIKSRKSKDKQTDNSEYNGKRKRTK